MQFQVLSFYLDILDIYRLPNGTVNSGDLPNGDVLMKVTMYFVNFIIHKVYTYDNRNAGK